MKDMKTDEIKKENDILRKQIKEIQDRYEYKISELSVLHELGRSIFCINDFKRLCEYILDVIIKNTVTQNCSIMFLDRKRNNLFLVCASNYYNNRYIIETKKIFSKDDDWRKGDLP